MEGLEKAKALKCTLHVLCFPLDWIQNRKVERTQKNMEAMKKGEGAGVGYCSVAELSQR